MHLECPEESSCFRTMFQIDVSSLLHRCHGQVNGRLGLSHKSLCPVNVRLCSKNRVVFGLRVSDHRSDTRCETHCDSFRLRQEVTNDNGFSNARFRHSDYSFYVFRVDEGDDGH